jgi:hypothetical protein
MIYSLLIVEISMRIRIAAAPLTCAPIDVPFAPTAFLIASLDQDLVQKYPHVFEYGKAEYNYGVDSFISHDELGEGEGAAVGLDREWLLSFQNCLGATIYQDQHDSSSQFRSRPDYTIVYRGAIVLKVESKGAEGDMAQARAELTAKFHQTASEQFPAPHFSIFGVVSCPSKIEIYLLSYDRRTHTYSSCLITGGTFNVRAVPYDRIRFVQVVFNILRWVSAIHGPHREFHLIPGIRTKTPNGHYITFTSEGILKEYSSTIDRRQIGYMSVIYKAKLPNVEWGRVIGERSVMITRIGVPLTTAISEGRTNRRAAEDSVRAGLNQLHELGYAHCDVKVANVYVDSSNIVFLDDIEYLTPVASTDWVRPFPNDRPRPATAGDLDELYFELFQLEMLRL